uniref:Uncharacterized protein n=1 Tax=Parascaris equorum TaxID=6256 RepID=A0A914R3W5_PAREQ
MVTSTVLYGMRSYCLIAMKKRAILRSNPESPMTSRMIKWLRQCENSS